MFYTLEDFLIHSSEILLLTIRLTLGFDLKGNGFGLSTKEATSLELPETQRKATPVLQGENR